MCVSSVPSSYGVFFRPVLASVLFGFYFSIWEF